MQRGRKTNDPKRNFIRLRLNDEMQSWLFQKSQKEKKTISELIRDLISKDMQVESTNGWNPKPSWWELKG